MRNLLALSLIAALSLPICAVADDAATVKKQAEANHVKTMAAFAKKDVKGMMAYCSNDYEAVSPMGKLNREQTAAMMKQYMQSTKKVYSNSYKVSDVKVSGNKATGKAVFTLDAQIMDAEGMFGIKGKSHRMKMEDTNKVTWTRSNGNWLTSREEQVSSKMIIDGKPFDPMAQAAPNKGASK
jgi:hypothetical protein